MTIFPSPPIIIGIGLYVLLFVWFFFPFCFFADGVLCEGSRLLCCPRFVILTVVVQLGACHRLMVPHVYLQKWLVLVVTLIMVVFLGMKISYAIQ